MSIVTQFGNSRMSGWDDIDELIAGESLVAAVHSSFQELMLLREPVPKMVTASGHAIPG